MWAILVFFLEYVSFMDETLRRVSKFLNRKESLFLQTTVWACVAYVCIVGYDFKDSKLSYILMFASFPAAYLLPLGFILIFFKPSISSTIAKLFANHQHLYKFLVSFVEVTIMWLITLVKAPISAQEGSLLLELLIISLYFIIITVCELLRIMDRGKSTLF